jgi:hypothetical protein
MTARARAGFQYKLANFVGDFLQIFDAQLPQIGGRIYFR